MIVSDKTEDLEFGGVGLFGSMYQGADQPNHRYFIHLEKPNHRYFIHLEKPNHRYFINLEKPNQRYFIHLETKQ